MAADTLGPLAGAKTKGVLADALRAFANKGGGDLMAMTALLADLPEGVSEIGNADKLAAKMADELKAAVATNPMLKATGPVLEPKLLFFGGSDRRHASSWFILRCPGRVLISAFLLNRETEQPLFSE